MDETPIEQPSEKPEVPASAEPAVPVASPAPAVPPPGWWRSLDRRSRAALWVAAGALVVAVAIAAFGLSRVHHADRIGFAKNRAVMGSRFRGPMGGERPGGLRDMRAQGLTAAAKAIGVSESDLTGEVSSGKSIAEVAKEHHVDVQKVIDAIVSTERAQIDDAVKSGRMPKAMAARIEAMLEQTVAARVYATGGQRMIGPGMMGGGGPYPG